MQQNVQADCPRCGRLLQNFNGHIGYCSQHKWVSPAGLGFEAEAAEQNRIDTQAEENKRLEIERKKQEEIARQKQEAHTQTVRKAVMIIIAILAIAAGAIFFIVRPSMNYNNAGKKFETGDYESARDDYTALGTYKDSAEWVTLCDALIELRNGYSEKAAVKIDQLIGEGQKELSSKLGDVLRSMMADWKNKGLTAELLLHLLQKIDVVDPKGKLDQSKLTLEGHEALLEDEYLMTFSKDVTGDDIPELITLNLDYTVTSYRMAPDNNYLVPMEKTEQAECLVQFGNEISAKDISLAAICFMEAYRLNSIDENRSVLEGAIRTILQEWKDRGIAPKDIPALARYATEEKLDLPGIDAKKVYEESAIAASGNPLQYTFTDWDHDGYMELLALYNDGKITLSGVEGNWNTISAAETKLPAGTFVVAEEQTPLILIGSVEKDELVVLTGAGNKLDELFRESGISRLDINSSPVTFSRQLSGSITRIEDYSYDAEGTENRPVRISVDWQKNAYPQPASAYEAVQRYFESRCYDILEETNLLITDPETDLTFDPQILSDLPSPTDLEELNIASYRTEDGIEYFEVSYQSGTKNVRSWVTVEGRNGWKVAGAAETYAEGQSIADIDFSIPILSLNTETLGSLSDKGSRATYRVMIPYAGRAGLSWQSGSVTENSASYIVSMTIGSLYGKMVFSYSLKPSPNIQQTTDLFTAAGIYYVTVEANAADTDPYILTISYKPDPYVEKENNDTYQTATGMDLNTAYFGNLSAASDEDWYSFTLDTPSSINLSIGTSGRGRGSSTSQTFTLYNGNDGNVLTITDIPGNARLTESGPLYLSAGTYLIQVAKGNSVLTDEYTLTINTLATEDTCEQESNDLFESANVIPVNEDVLAGIGKEGDIDFFRFSLEHDSVIQPRFSFKPTDNSSKTYVLTVSNDVRQELLKVNIGGKESSKFTVPLALTAGDYFVKIENPRFIRQDYTLNIYCEPVDAAEKEINDSAGLANHLLLGQVITGVLSSEADIDYYRLKFDAEKAVTLKFAFTAAAFNDTSYVLTIEQNGKTQWTANIKGGSGGLEQQLQFPAGEYYIRIKPSALVGAVYTVEVK